MSEPDFDREPEPRKVRGPAANRLLSELAVSPPVRAGLMGESPAIESLLQRVVRLARSQLPVLIVGEVGSGKENVARALHLNSERASASFIGEACSHLREPFLLGRLFGHERGAFTGAHAASPGLFELANRGTLFLDEIRDLSLTAQACLLRVLDSGEYRPLGSSEVRRSEFRLIAATAFDARSLVGAGLLRADLYFRLRGAVLRVPPLRERREDILELVEWILRETARTERRAPNLLSDEARHALVSHRWPGNVRELRHEITQALIVADRGEITPEMLSFVSDPPPDPMPIDREGREAVVRTLRRDLGEYEEVTIRDALRLAGGNKAEAARRLGITRRTLYRRLRRFDSLRRGSFRSGANSAKRRGGWVRERPIAESDANEPGSTPETSS